MKNQNQYKKITLLLLFLFMASACEDFLDEEPLDFFSPENSFNDEAGFESSLVDLYARVRAIHFEGGGGGGPAYAHVYGTDIMKDARESGATGRFGNYTTVLNSTSNIISWHWERWYKVISNANIILSQLENVELGEENERTIEAEAKFFRGLAYRYLVYLYGGVPLVTEEITSPRADFTRSTREEILNQVIEDLTFALANLPTINEVEDGRVSNLVAQHYLAETYLTQGNYDAAIAAATTVIDNANTSLMLDRFGSRATEEPGDVYWDLFRRGNQNRSNGNTEALWVAQMEFNVPGGLIEPGFAGNAWERNHVPVSWTLNDPDGNNGMLGPRSDANVGGRGVSFMRPTDFFENTLWVSDFDNDIRNASHNYVRDIVYDNPGSAFFGMSAKDNPGSILLNQDWRWYPYLTKVTTPGNHPSELIADATLMLLTTNAGATVTDQYYLRLAETYLLRAEAHLANGDNAGAAADINVVRARVNANPVAAGEVDLDYILDERARELSLEETRRITLHRTGKLVERVRLYNGHNADEIEDFHNLWPIPNSEIVANIDGDLAQNPGYN